MGCIICIFLVSCVEGRYWGSFFSFYGLGMGIVFFVGIGRYFAVEGRIKRCLGGGEELIFRVRLCSIGY